MKRKPKKRPKKKATKANKADDAVHALLDLYDAYRPSLGTLAWEWDAQRWHELLVATLVEGAEIEPAVARSFVFTTTQMGLSTVERLAALGTEVREFLEGLLTEAGASSDSARLGCAMIQKVAILVSKKWAGHVTRFLHAEALRMTKALASELQGADLSKADSERIAALWLQNNTSLPLFSATARHVSAACRELKLTAADVEQAADHLGLGPHVAEDLLMLHLAEAASKSV